MRSISSRFLPIVYTGSKIRDFKVKRRGSSRKTELLAFAKERGCSISDLDMQLAFLCSELETKYPGVLAKLQSATSIREASDYVLIHFEAPYDQSESVKAQRAGYGSAYYYRYGQNTEN